MFPEIELGSLVISMTGLGVVVSLLVFLLVSYLAARKAKVHFWPLFYRTPVTAILIYLGGRIVHRALTGAEFPANFRGILGILAPNDFALHLVGVLLGAAISVWIFLRKIKRVENKKIFVDVLFVSASRALGILGIFLFLGDHFVGLPSEAWWAVTALSEESSWNKFGGVLPIGLLLTLGTAVIAWIVRWRKNFRKKSGRGMVGFGWILLWIAFVSQLQLAPRYGVVALGPTSVDVRQYLCVALAIFCFLVADLWAGSQRDLAE